MAKAKDLGSQLESPAIVHHWCWRRFTILCYPSSPFSYGPSTTKVPQETCVSQILTTTWWWSIRKEAYGCGWWSRASQHLGIFIRGFWSLVQLLGIYPFLGWPTSRKRILDLSINGWSLLVLRNGPRHQRFTCPTTRCHWSTSWHDRWRSSNKDDGFWLL